MKKSLIVLVVLFIVSSVAVAGEFSFRAGKKVIFENEREFVEIILKSFGQDMKGSAHFVLSDTTSARDEVQSILTQPEQLILEEDSPVSLYSTVDQTLRSTEFRKSCAKNGSKNVFVVEIEIKNKDMISLYTFEGEKVVDSRGIGNYRGLRIF